jgi:diguanylate cyclase
VGANTNTTWQSCTEEESLTACNRRLRLRVAELEREVVRVQRLAYHDSLTGLPNRELLIDRLGQAMAQAVRQRKAVGLLLLDLNDFKCVNDEFGHSAGDVVLQNVAARLSRCIRACDTACRYGGDEFIILLPEIETAEEVRVVVNKIQCGLARPHRLGSKSIVIGASCGAVLFKGEPVNFRDLIDSADAAMYRSKKRGGSIFIIATATGEECD